MPPRPDSQSFTKFVISAGVFLVIAALVVPGLILRDTDALTISKRDLHGLTPTATDELERRQTIAKDAGHVAPYVLVAFLVAGAGLISYGVPRLKRQERTAEEREGMEMDKLRGELKPQTPLEREERLHAEVEEEDEATSSDAAEAVGGPPPVTPSESSGKPPARALNFSFSQLQRWAQVEADVLARLAKIAPPRYELQPQVKLEGEFNLLLDALLISQIDQLPDIVVEIKFSSAVRNFRNRMAAAESQLLRYMARYRRRSIGWLIFYVEEDLSPQKRAEIEGFAASLEDFMRVSVVTPESLASLSLPVDR